MAESTPDPEVGFRKVAHQSLWNILGLTAPMLVAVFAIPVMIDQLGTARFGLLSIAGLVIGYMGVLDFGLGQAQGYFVARERTKGDRAAIGKVFWTGISMILALSLLLGLCLHLLLPLIVERLIKVEGELAAETLAAFRIIPLTVPLVMIAPCLIATLEAFGDFRRISLIRIPTASSYFLAPLIVIPFSPTLPAVVAALTAGRILEVAAFAWCCRSRIASLCRPSPALARRMLGFGGWVTISNLLQPAMIHGDRFFLASTRGPVAVTWYVTPAELIVRLLVLPRALVTVLFPNLTVLFATGKEGVAELFETSLLLLMGVMFVGCSVLMLIGPPALEVWLTPEFRENSGPVLRLLALGIFSLALAYVPQFLVQASGKPSATARIHLIQFPIYLVLAWIGPRLGGAPGAALAWALRAAVERILMLRLARRRVPTLSSAAVRTGWIWLCLFLILAAILALPDTLPATAAGLAFVALWIPLYWWFILTPQARVEVLGILRRRPSP